MPAFSKILIANRGEIACRIQRTAQALGYRTVAVYSDADTDALHVQMADEAVHIGPAPVHQSYLNTEAILAAAQLTGADAIHPGYGFLSENPDFARACLQATLTFIGPSAEAIELMGSKRLSKLAMLDAGVPCIAGYQGSAQDDATLQQEAERIGFPLMIKASAGGGGRGMRLVHQREQLLEQLRTARSEAMNAFGSDELILEQALIDPRHVEVQLFGDRHGNLIYLGERDCSIQRRHQKVIEEAPCPVMTADLRQAMGEAALKAGRAVNYVGAGTVEFLLDRNGQFYFLEMNTRLQVEHPVTEMITGLDLVDWQLQIAAGQPLPLTQSQVTLTGHAMEVRLYAEDPAQGFLPQTGDVLRWEPAPGVRIDHGLLEGQTVSPFYDPMLGKIIAHGASREEARRKLLRAVEDSVLLGVATNQRLLIDLLKHPDFINGDFSTGLIAEHFSVISQQTATAEQLSLAAALFYQHSANQHPQTLARWRNTASVPATYRLEVNGQLHSVSVDDLQLTTDSRHASLVINGIRRRIAYHLDGNRLWLPGLTVTDRTQQVASRQADASSGTVQAPMDGAIVDIRVCVGEAVSKGQLLLVLEAMKMEHPLKAGIDGTVKEMRVMTGDQVRNRQVLLEIE
ncbi:MULTISPECIES: acetyl/propionyl/methylcrotonyl-CoA carboxylase subunit alpha [unclassified Pseudomonas]|jgi:geranyl-CoA carboxylase alpha subunit|uniref:acetyl-CoA carboxylase biotin carboxylase subunit n=2 Tax=Pseudomonas TaxID=286 RepID=UPI0003580FAC|nr:MULTISPECIES: acetyl/propionyl/methylcrotonyl-CoA carboxylase subunit alpha [unclassified Pseudomonas]OKP67216.1 3-methylcrotonyl-CoA carboxylase [Pseudomonas fluorescens]EPJ81557.1 putative acetyl-/propionyl-coenzyme A carboxylase alpha chain protein [Pseudomonas sp. CFT9]MCF5511015.1 acetyl-CoA carboxylase biotin carboxylase subunit [Pseudomonas sp. PA-3-6H]MCF5516242.1 acetyl-CoA carboxylase biotin carboxylase subunit [Pseudomonas sp. PA-3-6E]MCF5564643.1 acetyl-CoA carboxylase biotin ca